MQRDMSKREIILCATLIILTAFISIRISVPKYIAGEANEALGDRYEMKMGWTVEEESEDIQENITLPYKASRPSTKKAKLTYTTSTSYSGKTLSLYATNAKVNVYLDDKRIYVSGTANGLKNLDRPQYNTDEGAQVDAGELIMDLPERVWDGHHITITLEQISPNVRMALLSAKISDRDVAVMDIIRQAAFPTLCAILIVMCAVILQSLDVIRLVHHKRTRGLVIIVLYAIDTIFFNFVRSDIFYLFFGNRQFFLTLEEVSCFLMPVVLTGFYFRGFKIHAPKKTRIIFYSSVGIALVDLISYPYWGGAHQFMYQVNMLWRIFIIILLMDMLVRWKRQRPESRQILWDECALVCILLSVLSNPLQTKVAGYEFLYILSVVSALGYFVFMVIQHVQIILAERQYAMKQQMQAMKEHNFQLIVATQEAEAAREEAILATEAKSRFLANMSHEIRTPINAVLGMDEMILRRTRDSEIREYAVDIQSAGRTLLSLINDILDFSKIESGKLEIVPAEYESASLISDLINMISTRAESKGLEFVTDISEDIPRGLFGDDVRLRQCVTNLLTNAVKYTKTGSVSFKVSAERKDKEAVLHFEVRDTGIGIKEEDLSKLFTAYERIEESRNRNIEGTGLGMNITLQMLELMGAKLDVESVYGEGSCFSFDVSQGIVDDRPMGALSMRHEEIAAAAVTNGKFIAPDAKILVTDDNAMNRKVLINLLDRIRLQIDEASGGVEAVEKAKTNHYDMIFMDHMMPEMDGIEAMQAIRALPDSPCADTKIYVLTANAVTGAKEMYMEAGFDGFLSKPVLSDKLEAALQQNLPSELLLPAPDDEGEEYDSASASMPDDLPVVDGLDWSFAWEHLPGEDMLAETLKQFHVLIPVQGKKLEKFYEMIDTPEGLEEYRIQVHGMKGLAATVGIIPLAGAAKLLEFGARDGDTDLIRHLHPIFIKEWYSYQTKLVGVFGIFEEKEDESDKPPAPYRATLARLEMLRQAMDEFDMDRGDELMAELNGYLYPEAISGIIEELSCAVADIDSDAVSSYVDNILNAGEW